MMQTKTASRYALVLLCALASGCAGSGSLVNSPTVDLTSVEVSDMSFTNQTFLLGFSVNNPNPFPIPVKAVSYRVRLNDENFAGGETQSDFTVPAGGDEHFVISVDVNLLKSGAQLTSIIRSGMRDRIDYEVLGDLAVDIPLVPSMRFSNSGTIMVQSELF
jgi:LEA14-like dessication related protein